MHLAKIYANLERYLMKYTAAMKKICIAIFVFLSLFLSAWVVENTYANEFSGANNLYIGTSDGSESSWARNNDKLRSFNENDQFISVSRGGGDGLFNTLIRFARDLKNLFYAVATVFFLVIALRLILATNTEEELWKFKKGIIWITVGLIVMQLAYSFVFLTFDKWVSAQVWFNLIQYLIDPLINLLETLVSLFFIGIAIFAFYTMVTANGNEEAIKNAKMSIFYALIGFLLVRFARGIVEAFYGRMHCEDISLGFITIQIQGCVMRTELSEWVNIIVTVINWLNGFVAIVVLLMIIYAGIQILLSWGDEEKVKKWRQSIVYIAIWLLVLALNYLILTFFFVPESVI